MRMMNDTHPEAERVQIELFRQAGPERRAQLAMDLTDRVIRTARAGIARANPQLSPVERQLLFVEVSYGREIATHLRDYLRQRESAA